MSRFHFARLFRLGMGTMPHRYLMDQRLQQGKALLRLDARSVSEIALEPDSRMLAILPAFSSGTSE
jgi:AraC family transcriptional regulator